MKEFLGEKAVRDLFDIIAENYVTHKGGGTSSVEDGEVATDEEVADVLENYFN